MSVWLVGMNAFARSGKLVAVSVKVQRMIGDAEVQNVSGHILYLLYARVAEFENLPAVLADKVVVLRILVRTFKMGNVLTELMLRYQFAVEQQLYRVVQGGPAHAVVLLLHLYVQRFDVEMSRVRIDLMEYGKPFGRFAVPVLLQVVGEDLPYVVEYFGLYFRYHFPGEGLKVLIRTVPIMAAIS